MPALRLPHALLGAATASLLILAGCAAPPQPIPRYTPPASGPTAKLAMRGAGGDLYGVFVYGDSESCGQKQIAGGARTNGEPPKSIVLAAGQWATLDYVAIDNVRKTQCRVRWSFQPTADRTYVLSGMANTTHCAARVFDATNPDDMKLEPTAIQRSTADNLCLSIADAQERKKRATAKNPVATTKDEPLLVPSATPEDLKGLINP